jgi:ABC-type sugar transport system substrate-binding protein
MADRPRPLSATFHVGESCAFADGPGVWPITRGQRERTVGLGWQFTSLDAALSAEKQANDIAELVEWRVDALTAYTLDTTLAEPGYERARAAGIPVVTFGSESPSAVAVIRQRVDSALCAANAVAYLAARVRYARVLVIGGPPIPALAARTRHFLDAATRAGLRVVAHEDNIGDVEETARPIVQRLLDDRPDIDAIWCFNDYTALAAGTELRRRGRPVQSGSQAGVIVSGIGGIPAMIEAIRRGRATFTYDSRPVDAGRAAIDVLEAFLVRHEKPQRELWVDFARHDLSNLDTYVSWGER